MFKSIQKIQFDKALRGIVSRDFWHLVFLVNHLRVISIFFENSRRFASQVAPSVSTKPVAIPIVSLIRWPNLQPVSTTPVAIMGHYQTVDTLT